MRTVSKLLVISVILANVLSPFSAPASPQPFSQTLSVPEASAIVGISNGHFFVVDDEKGIFHLNRELQARLVLSAMDHKFLTDLEGISISSDQQFLYCLSEEGGKISKIRLRITENDVSLDEPKPLGNLPTIGETPNKGWEGICVLNFSGEDRLLAVHQEKPRAIGMFSLPALKQLSMCKLPEELKNLLKNLSDITIDNRNGHLLLLSGKSARIVELKATIDSEIRELEVISVTKLNGELRGKPEGICFDSKESLVVVTDGDGEASDFIRLHN